MTTSEIDPSAVDSEEAANQETHASPTGNWSPYTPPPTAAPPTGNWSPYTPPNPPPNAVPQGNWSPYTPPSTVVPEGNWSPYTPPPAGDGAAPQAQPGPAQGNPAGRPDNSPARTGVITQLWSASTVPGVWALVSGVGWKRLAGAEFGHSALISLALLARANGLGVSFHEDAQGQIDQLLV